MNVSIRTQQFRHSTALAPSPAPEALFRAGTCLADQLAQGRAVDTDALRAAMEEACGDRKSVV